MNGMPGMMSDSDMSRLDAATGDGFDQMFLTMMIEHHAGAVDMAKAEESKGKNADATALAKQVQTAQTAEITEMKKLFSPEPPLSVQRPPIAAVEDFRHLA